MQHIVIQYSLTIVFVSHLHIVGLFIVISHQQCIPESFGHVELLQHSIHVTDTP